MRKTTVLIIGAGPTGLMMACQLSLQNIPFIILDQDTSSTKESRAIGIQARTLEIFRQMGLAEKFIQGGYIAHGLSIVIKGKISERASLTGLGDGLSEFPFLLIHEQAKTEKNLIEFLEARHHAILWDTKLLSFTQDKHNVRALIKHNHHAQEEIEADWIVGADGAHSMVRHILGIPLAGKTYQQSLFVLDCKIEAPVPSDDISIIISDYAFAAFFPMVHGHWRIVGELPGELANKQEITFEDIAPRLTKQLQLPLTLSDPYWISAYHSHHRCVSTFNVKRAFLLGDAAHIHSPVGAQGMNTGFQDAYNLAWKLAFVSQQKAKTEILSTYSPERIAFAKRLVATTDKVFNFVSSPNPIFVFLREHLFAHVVNLITTHKKTGRFFFRMVSQIGIEYRHSLLSRQASIGTFPPHTPQPGDRLPYVLYNDGKEEKNIQDLIKVTKLQLLIFCNQLEEVTELIQSITPYKDTISYTLLLFSPETKQLFAAFGIETSGYYLVRPDMHIAFRCASVETSQLHTYLARFFTHSS